MRLLTAALLSLAFCAPAAQAAPRCGAFPSLQAPTLPGWCTAIVARGAHGLRMPRSVLWLGRTDNIDQLLVLDLGSWEPNRGRLLLLQVDAATGTTRSTELLAVLDRPHGLRRGPDGRIYLAEATRITRFAWPLEAGRKPEPENVVDGLPAEGRHPLKQIVFAPDGSLYIGVGSTDDRCEAGAAVDAEGRPQCAQMQGPRPQAAVYRARMAWPQGNVEEMATFAIGLRNSTALAVHPSGAVLQGENNVDLPEENFPAEEINRLEAGGHYGWPGCVERGKPLPDAPPSDCSKTRNPIALMPAHAAPLHMDFSRIGSEQGQLGLLVGWHGYRKAGQRVVRYELRNGVPTGKPRVLLGPWAAGPNRPGSPVGWAEDDAGQLWIADDRNRMLLRLGPQAPAVATHAGDAPTAVTPARESAAASTPRRNKPPAAAAHTHR